MIRVIFDNGEIMNCDNISKIYVEEVEMEKIIMLTGENQRLRDIVEKHLDELREEKEKALISYSDAEKTMMLRKIQEEIT